MMPKQRNQNPIFTNILPIFSPLNRAKKVLGACSMRSVTVSIVTVQQGTNGPTQLIASEQLQSH
jgi:hypothetical protein